ncbi:MAG: hypothetical protein KJN77_06150 [Gammaproteobacteria bacterium]|nr:hypothetical protein [Gammaproteobacteria bacterium]
MLRLTGILTGSALTIAVLLVMIGIPQLTGPAGEAGSSPGNEDPVTPETVAATELPVMEFPVDEVAPLTEPEPAPPPALQPDANLAPEALETGALVNLDPLVEVQDAPATELNWFAFWSPFRSEIAADGFVSELQRTTGLDYRVVKLKPGVYEVAFAYSNDADREDKLSRIETATGLDMSDG